MEHRVYAVAVGQGKWRRRRILHEKGGAGSSVILLKPDGTVAQAFQPTPGIALQVRTGAASNVAAKHQLAGELLGKLGVEGSTYDVLQSVLELRCTTPTGGADDTTVFVCFDDPIIAGRWFKALYTCFSGGSGSRSGVPSPAASPTPLPEDRAPVFGERPAEHHAFAMAGGGAEYAAADRLSSASPVPQSRLSGDEEGGVVGPHHHDDRAVYGAGGAASLSRPAVAIDPHTRAHSSYESLVAATSPAGAPGVDGGAGEGGWAMQQPHPRGPIHQLQRRPLAGGWGGSGGASTSASTAGGGTGVPTANPAPSPPSGTLASDSSARMKVFARETPAPPPVTSVSPPPSAGMAAGAVEPTLMLAYAEATAAAGTAAAATVGRMHAHAPGGTTQTTTYVVRSRGRGGGGSGGEITQVISPRTMSPGIFDPIGGVGGGAMDADAQGGSSTGGIWDDDPMHNNMDPAGVGAAFASPSPLTMGGVGEPGDGSAHARSSSRRRRDSRHVSYGTTVFNIVHHNYGGGAPASVGRAAQDVSDDVFAFLPPNPDAVHQPYSMAAGVGEDADGTRGRHPSPAAAPVYPPPLTPPSEVRKGCTGLPLSSSTTPNVTPPASARRAAHPASDRDGDSEGGGGGFEPSNGNHGAPGGGGRREESWYPQSTGRGALSTPAAPLDDGMEDVDLILNVTNSTEPPPPPPPDATTHDASTASVLSTSGGRGGGGDGGTALQETLALSTLSTYDAKHATVTGGGGGGVGRTGPARAPGGSSSPPAGAVAAAATAAPPGTAPAVVSILQELHTAEREAEANVAKLRTLGSKLDGLVAQTATWRAENRGILGDERV